MTRLLLVIGLTLVPGSRGTANDPSEDWRLAVENARQFAGQGQFHQAEQELAQALRLAEAFGPLDRRTILTLNDFASLQQTLGRVAEAEKLYRRVLAACECVESPDRTCVVRVSGNLASLYVETGQYAKAERLAHRALSLLDAGADPADLARLYLYLAGVSFHRSEYEEAEALYQRSLAMWEKAVASDCPEAADVLNNIASIRIVTGRPADAIPLLERAVAIFEGAFGPVHPHLIRPLSNLAVSQAMAGSIAEAVAGAARARSVAENTLGPDHNVTGETLLQCAVVLRRAGRGAEAKALEKRARALISRHERDNLLGHTVDFHAYTPPAASASRQP
jgi:tetratricopeptide (TPR) repeat protein